MKAQSLLYSNHGTLRTDLIGQDYSGPFSQKSLQEKTSVMTPQRLVIGGGCGKS